MKEKNNIFHRIVEDHRFQRFIIGVIVGSAALIGFETYSDFYHSYHSFFVFIDHLIQTVFTLEIIIRILAFGKKPFEFFKHSNNIIDFLITAVFYLPFGGTYAAVFRLIRVLRIFRLFTALPRLQILVGALVKSFPSMGYISLLLLIQMYMFAIVGVALFGQNDPGHFGNLGNSLLTLFQIITLEGWAEIMQQQPETILTILYFVSFILLGTMIILNLFIGVIISGFDEVKKEIEEELNLKKKKPSIHSELDQISTQLDVLSRRLSVVIGQQKKDLDFVDSPASETRPSTYT